MAEMFEIVSICRGGGYRYCRTLPIHPRANANGLYPLHRVVMENKLGRLLEPWEDVHHEDEDKSNDAPDNLSVKSHSKHISDHRRMPPVELMCQCGKAFLVTASQMRLRKKRNLTGKVFCSRVCGAKLSKQK